MRHVADMQVIEEWLDSAVCVTADTDHSLGRERAGYLQQMFIAEVTEHASDGTMQFVWCDVSTIAVEHPKWTVVYNQQPPVDRLRGSESISELGPDSAAADLRLRAVQAMHQAFRMLKVGLVNSEIDDAQPVPNLFRTSERDSGVPHPVTGIHANEEHLGTEPRESLQIGMMRLPSVIERGVDMLDEIGR